jgi:hypothetical protein
MFMLPNVQSRTRGKRWWPTCGTSIRQLFRESFMTKELRFGKRLVTAPLVTLLLICSRLAFAQTADSPLPRGCVGLGTYATISQFKDLDVVAGDKVLLHKSLSAGTADFDLSGGGQWRVFDYVLQQSNTDARGMNIFTGDKNWTDYAVSVKARKVSGKEGFSLCFRALDSDNFACLNVGGWSNARTQFGITLGGTFSTIGTSTNFTVQEDRWYDVKVEVKGKEVNGYVDGAKVAWAELIQPPPAAAAGRGRRGGGNPPPDAPAPVAAAPAAAPTYSNNPTGSLGSSSASDTPTVIGNTSSTSGGVRQIALLAVAGAATVALLVVGAMWLRGRKPTKAA